MTGRALLPRGGWSALIAASLLLAASPGASAAQGWTLDLFAGRASFETLPVDATSTNASVGLRFGEDHRTFQLSLAGPLAADNLFWGVVGAGDRLAYRTGRVVLGADLLGQGHVQRDPLAGSSGRSLRADLLPLASVSVGPVVLEGRSGASLYRASADGQSWSRELWHSDLRASFSPVPRLRITGEVRHARTGEEAYTFTGAAVAGLAGRLAVWGSVGDWTSGLPSDQTSVAWGGGAALPLGARATVWATVRRDPFDPLYLAGSRTSWGVGMSYRVGGARPTPPPAGPEIRGGNRVVIRLPLRESSAPPFVAGDFTEWEPVPMYRHGAEWRLEIALDPGVYQYAFRRGASDWFVPESVPGRRDDGMGGWVAVLIVP